MNRYGAECSYCSTSPASKHVTLANQPYDRKALLEVELEGSSGNNEKLIDEVVDGLGIAPMNSAQTISFISELNGSKEIQSDLGEVDALDFGAGDPGGARRMMTTQIGGKYHSADDSVFRLKRAIDQLGIRVTHPLADEIRATADHHAFAFDPEQHVFSDVERHYYESIRTCDFHTVCNRFKDAIGYIGGSASLELAFAMCHQRPVMLLHYAKLAPSVDPFIRDFLLGRLDRVSVHDFLTEDTEENMAAIARLAPRLVDYEVNARAQIAIQRRVDNLICGLAAKYVAT